jgi:hypothetical protein
MGRWLAPQLPGAQHWVVHDRDAALLARAAADPPGGAADGDAVTVETRTDDISRLGPQGLAGAGLVTAAALLDILTADELDRVVASCVAAGCPALVTLTVVGRVGLTPSDPLDERVTAAFNAHQRRRLDGDRRLLGPDAVDAAADAFRRLGADVVVRPSPWRLGAAEAALAVEWLDGWVGAAAEQDPRLAADLDGDGYPARRVAEARAGLLRVAVHHQDLLALPG